MYVYLPIAQVSLNIFLLLGLGGAVGMLSGMFGIGGGFLLTPMLMFLGVPAEVAVATGANQVVGTSVAGAVAQWRRNNVDVEMGLVLIAGGVVGVVAGVEAVRIMRAMGQVEIFIALCYVVVLTSIGMIMLIESVRALRQSRGAGISARPRAGQHTWIQGLPLRWRFHRSRLYVSVVPPFLLGLFVGVLSAIMGVGGGFILVPAMIYLLRMETRIVIGTSVLQIAIVTALATVLHAVLNQTVDLLLALLLLLGGVLGAEFGARLGEKLSTEQLRIFLALLVLAMGLRLFIDLALVPREAFSLGSRA
jgi:hypothetical protein